MEGTNIVPVMDMNRNNNYGDCWGGGKCFLYNADSCSSFLLCSKQHNQLAGTGNGSGNN